MAKSIKLKNEKYLASQSVVFKQTTLQSILNDGRVTTTSFDSYSDWDSCLTGMKEQGINMTQVYQEKFDTKGAPIGAYHWGLLISIKMTDGANSYYDIQFYIPDNNSYIYYRTMNSLRKNYWLTIDMGSDKIDAYGY
jgi:hypothetical protein